LSGSTVVAQDTRRSTAVTCTGVQTPPRAVATPRALSARAMARNDVAPAAFICSITGSTLDAKRQRPRSDRLNALKGAGH
jgi:hypothetical protein